MTDSKEGDGNELDKHLKDATILISTPFHPACECNRLRAEYWSACTTLVQMLQTPCTGSWSTASSKAGPSRALWSGRAQQHRSCCSHCAAVRPLQSVMKQVAEATVAWEVASAVSFCPAGCCRPDQGACQGCREPQAQHHSWRGQRPRGPPCSCRCRHDRRRGHRWAEAEVAGSDRWGTHAELRLLHDAGPRPQVEGPRALNEAPLAVTAARQADRADRLPAAWHLHGGANLYCHLPAQAARMAQLQLQPAPAKQGAACACRLQCGLSG